MRSAKSGRNTTTRCHSVFELHSSSTVCQERCVARENTVNFKPLPFARRCSGSAPTNPTRVTELRYDIFESPFLPHFLGAPKSERLLLPRRAAALWEGPVLFGRNRESRKPRSCRAQELARSSAQENERQKRWMYPDSVNRFVKSAGCASPKLVGHHFLAAACGARRCDHYTRVRKSTSPP